MKRLALWQTRCLAKSSVRRAPACDGIYKPNIARVQYSRQFHSSLRRDVVVPYMLADIGEGITECQIIEWFVQPGSRVEQFDRICEVQSDKASVEITSRFDGVIKALHYSLDDMAMVGKPLVDIDIDGDLPAEDNIKQEAEASAAVDIQRTAEPTEPQILEGAASELRPLTSAPRAPPQQDRKRGADIATPAVRHMIKELNLNIRDIPGTGKDGRVRKEDIERYTAAELTIQPPSEAKAKSHPTAEDRVVSLTPTENQMLKVMTQSLSIPHFLYTHAVDVTLLNTLRTRWNSSTHSSSAPSRLSDSYSRLTALPFIMKAISQAIAEFPKVNSHLDLGTTPNKPQLILKASHSFGLAIDTPQGLLVPVVRDVQNHSIHSLAAEINRISALAHAGKLSPDDFKGATLSISNIGSIGGRVVSPVIVTPMVAIVGIGRARKVPAFQDTPDGERVLVEREEVVLSWSADHRVLDGATVAKCAERVGWMIENIDLAGLSMK